MSLCNCHPFSCDRCPVPQCAFGQQSRFGFGPFLDDLSGALYTPRRRLSGNVPFWAQIEPGSGYPDSLGNGQISQLKLALKLGYKQGVLGASAARLLTAF